MLSRKKVKVPQNSKKAEMRGVARRGCQSEFWGIRSAGHRVRQRDGQSR